MQISKNKETYIQCHNKSNNLFRHLETNCEVLWVELSFVPSKLFIGVFYNPPSSNRNTIHQLQSSLAALPGSLPVVLCGDFNLPNIDWSHFNPSPVVHSEENNLLCDAISDFNLQQMVMEPRRSANILDLLFTNRPDILHEVKVVDGLPGSDHDAVYFSINLGRRRISRQKQLVYNFKKANFDLFREMLSKIPWDCCFLSESINECWENFKDVLYSVADQCIPKVTLKSKKRIHWLSDETLEMVRKKRHAYELVKRTGNPHHLKRYWAISNKVRNLIRKDHVDHLELTWIKISVHSGIGLRMLEVKSHGFLIFTTLVQCYHLPVTKQGSSASTSPPFSYRRTCQICRS